MCILRSDYMIDQPTQSLKLVEYNNIASSFGCLSNKVHLAHEYVRSKYGSDLQFNYDNNARDYSTQIKKDSQLNALHFHDPGHVYSEKLVGTFKQALTIYKRTMKYGDATKDVWMLFVCEDDERNICDQKVMEVELMNKHNIRSMRRTLAELI